MKFQMTCKERADLMKFILENELLPLGTAKGRDYSEIQDCFSNFRDFGWKGVVVRMGDKFQRIKMFTKKGELEIKSETVEDTLLDLINYAFYTLIMYREEKK